MRRQPLMSGDLITVIEKISEIQQGDGFFSP